ncbi:hypothetical protein [Rhodovibrio salinarum]|uniref:Uncharacterized protein n=1 Tax=Rhodovibrio salinarum TaxID=1087 RepID=A0A934QHL4_9PROT|nr:hypothetical protein [Rhodovibrio salinarum]MBK1696675.1 hypothetical protein [Rhodovibrio salinarum]
MDDRQAIEVLSRIYPRSRRVDDRRGALRRAVDAKRGLILQMHVHGCSRSEIIQQLYREGVQRSDGTPLSPSQLSSLTTRCRILHGEPDPAAPGTTDPVDPAAPSRRRGEEATA